jgi:hypothetical protein
LLAEELRSARTDSATSGAPAAGCVHFRYCAWKPTIIANSPESPLFLAVCRYAQFILMFNPLFNVG